MREHLEAAARNPFAAIPSEYSEAPECPPELAHVWRWFWELDDTRPRGMAGPSPITYAEIDAWARLTGVSLRPFEIWALRAVDNACLLAAEKKG
jgi:hypothetical protein